MLCQPLPKPAAGKGPPAQTKTRKEHGRALPARTDVRLGVMFSSAAKRARAQCGYELADFLRAARWAYRETISKLS